MIPFSANPFTTIPTFTPKALPSPSSKKAKTPTLYRWRQRMASVHAAIPTNSGTRSKTLGVETQLVVYEHEGHHFAKPNTQRDRIRRTVAWFDAHLLQP